LKRCGRTRTENAETWLSLSEIEPERTRIELFDCVWWIYFRRLEPVPSPREAPTPAGG
jgi:hypothetical protein